MTNANKNTITKIKDYSIQISEVVAPCDLEGGYLLVSELNGEIRTVVVPEGGAKSGETFLGYILPQQGERLVEEPAPNPEPSVPQPMVIATVTEEPQWTTVSNATSIVTTATQDEPFDCEIPTGAWRDGIFDCCTDTTVCCMAYWCGIVLLGQVMTRLHLDWCAKPRVKSSESNACRILLGFFLVRTIALIIAFILFWVAVVKCYIEFVALMMSLNTGRFLNTSGENPDEYDESTDTAYTNFFALYDWFTEVAGPGITAAFWTLLGLAFSIFIYASVLMCRTRQKLREKYDIGGDRWRDCCCSFCCWCCTVSQMARHTNDYRAYPVACCSGDCWSKTGRNAAARAIEL